MPDSLHLPNIGHKAPIPMGARVGPLLCSSAIAGKNAADGSLPADGAEQVANAFANLLALLQAGGAGPQHVAKLSVTLADEALRETVNPHWLRIWPDANARPARHIHIQPLGHGMQVALEVVAYITD